MRSPSLVATNGSRNVLIKGTAVYAKTQPSTADGNRYYMFLLYIREDHFVKEVVKSGEAWAQLFFLNSRLRFLYSSLLRLRWRLWYSGIDTTQIPGDLLKACRQHRIQVGKHSERRQPNNTTSSLIYQGYNSLGDMDWFKHRREKGVGRFNRLEQGR